MLSYQPGFFQRSRFVQDQSQNVGVELDDFRTAFTETLDQFFVNTATWGLDRWESELDLTPAQDQPDAERRSRIISRLRGTGTATISIVKQVAESYDRGSIDVIEDFTAYEVTVEFVDTRGTPPNLDDLKKAVRAVVPAHLDLIYKLRYTLYQELNGVYTYDQIRLSGLTYGDLKTKLPA